MPHRSAILKPALLLSLLVAVSPLSACSLLQDITGGGDEENKPVRTYERGTMTYLERKDGESTVRVGVNRRWGGVISEVSLDGRNFVNAFDTGREVQLSLYDGDGRGDACAGCTGAWPWNPVQGGDRHGHASGVLAQERTDSMVYVKTRPLEWYPDDKGGSAARGVPTDMVYEMWVSVVPEHPRAFHVRFRATHEGSDSHAVAAQEVPAIYASSGFGNFVYYGGTRPWTSDSVTHARMRDLGDAAWPTARFYVPERWGAFVDAQGVGLTVYTPSAYPYGVGYQVASGSPGYDTHYFAPMSFFAVGPHAVIEADVYLVAGDVEASRAVVYDLHQRLPARDICSPILDLAPRDAQAAVSGVLTVAGVAFDDVALAAVEVVVDGQPVGSAQLGGASPGIQAAFSNAPVNSAFEYRLDTTRLPNGTRTVIVRATDTSGNTTVRRMVVNVAN